jgi:DNA-binding MarR family transcriptional regulator
MTKSDPIRQPIGFWLNRVDQALTRRMNQLLEADQITRIGWQVLNVLQSHGEMDPAQLDDLLQANASTQQLAETIDQLVAHGWVLRSGAEGEESAPTLRLTDAGQRQHAQLRDRIFGFRQQSLAGISEDEYRITIRVLERIVENLE